MPYFSSLEQTEGSYREPGFVRADGIGIKHGGRGETVPKGWLKHAVSVVKADTRCTAAEIQQRLQVGDQQQRSIERYFRLTAHPPGA